MKSIKVGNNQSIWDIAIQEYGSYDAVKQLMIDNPTKCDFENSISAGTELFISGEPTNKATVDYLSSNGLRPSTAIEVPFLSNWILATGLWDDNGFWDDNAVWID